MRVFVATISALLLGLVGANCPGNMENINEKCYLYGSATSREDALKQCQDIDPTNHLWLINDLDEMDRILQHFQKRLIAPWAWTDGVKSDEMEGDHYVWKWSSSGNRISVNPSASVDCDGNCVANDCDNNAAGDCAALGLNDSKETSFQGCDCAASIGFICESSDNADFECPENGFFPSEPCSDLWYNCWDGIAVPEYCGEGLVFNPENLTCDFPANVDGCSP
eukprot:TRINITY_DN38171_c0_g1_i1.p1 TRINITY_DN38171_c0_g1~~TRINITY_DN38171_c0_g1_i1.p1  ORF type:complete len:223 (-),score=34.91 TRINITY_DN38171_c0_g1_i1:136-804(-)